MKVRAAVPPAKAQDAAKSASTSKAADQGTAEAGLPSTSEGGVAYQYAPVQQMTEHREYIEYQLTVREQPKHSRMCGVGEKADRRPIDPAPIVQLRVITHDRPVRDAPISSSSTDPIAPPVERAAGHGPAVPSTPGVRRGVPVTTVHGDGWEDKAWYLENPYYFMYAMLCNYESDEELHLLQDGKTRYTSGSCVSCLYHLKDIDGSHQGFFVFPDLSIRVEGVYRLKLCLFETIGHTVHHCKSIYSAPFNVYTAKRFPGMEESTPLSKSFADQGLKVRVRKQPRMRRRSSKRKESSRSDGSDADNPPATLSGDRRSPKRSRPSAEPAPPVPPLPISAPHHRRPLVHDDGAALGPASNTPARGPYRQPSGSHHPETAPRHFRDAQHQQPPPVSPVAYRDGSQPGHHPGPPAQYQGYDRLPMRTPASRHMEESPMGMPMSRSLPPHRGFDNHADEAALRYGYHEVERDPRERLIQPPHRVDGGRVAPAYPPAPYADDEMHTLPPRGPPSMDSTVTLRRRDSFASYGDEDPRQQGRRMGPPPPGAGASWHRSAPGPPHASPDTRRGSADHRYLRSPGPDHLADHPRSHSARIYSPRGPTPERGGPSSLIADRQRLFVPSDRAPVRPSAGHSTGQPAGHPAYAVPAQAQLGVARPYELERPGYDTHRRPHPEERFVEPMPTRADGAGIPHRGLRTPLHEGRVPSRPMTPLEVAAEPRDGPTLPPIRDLPQLPSLRRASRHDSPVTRLPRAESFYDPLPRFPTTREVDPAMRSVSATPPIRRHLSSSQLGPSSHFQEPLPPRSPLTGTRQAPQYAPVAVRTLPALPSPDVERPHYGRAGSGRLPPPPPAPPPPQQQQQQQAGPPFDYEQAYGRSRRDERPREWDDERERALARERERERERDRDRQLRDRGYGPY
ncbi:uncharacterized protein PFL1_04961 [Pseudozyma flocculosa PF-1]|uniref:Velvet domain-containing protein n=2 Tax=Pseudozyma flocculosa TaxID=84751 RepID=A0A5C3EV62_9BASI|nr:uncharacterized protein PFL1_04961 [Pseudozyma flocculosa PF-1]EPQ27423.1 hypothetical protein PFL1_04961 [Pseudozyma flocculosa PF-1]SPO36153.1 uncharacterized protein PSFLO_01624 [Pseudozyma flocculosa]